MKTHFFSYQKEWIKILLSQWTSKLRPSWLVVVCVEDTGTLVLFTAKQPCPHSATILPFNPHRLSAITILEWHQMSRLVHNTININVLWLRRLWKTFLPHQYWWRCHALKSGALFKDLWEEWLLSRLGEGGVWEGGQWHLWSTRRWCASGMTPTLAWWDRREEGRLRDTSNLPAMHCLRRQKWQGKSPISGDLGMGNEGLLILMTEIFLLGGLPNAPVVGRPNEGWFNSSCHELTEANLGKQQVWFQSNNIHNAHGGFLKYPMHAVTVRGRLWGDGRLPLVNLAWPPLIWTLASSLESFLPIFIKKHLYLTESINLCLLCSICFTYIWIYIALLNMCK